MTVRVKGMHKLGLLAVPRGVTQMMHQVFFNAEGERPELVASDGKMLAVIPVDTVKGVKAQTGRVDGEAWGRATAGMKADEERQMTLTSDGHVLVRDDKGREIMTVPAGKPGDRMPPKNYRDAIPKHGTQQMAVAIDPVQIVKMAAILGCKQRLVLHADVNPQNGIVSTAMRVSGEPWSGDDQPHGVLMPIAIEEDRTGRQLVIKGKPGGKRG